MENNRHSAEVKLWFGHISRVYTHAKFEDLLNTSAVTSKTGFEQRGSYIRTINHCQYTMAIGTHYTKRSKGPWNISVELLLTLVTVT